MTTPLFMLRAAQLGVAVSVSALAAEWIEICTNPCAQATGLKIRQIQDYIKLKYHLPFIKRNSVF